MSRILIFALFVSFVLMAASHPTGAPPTGRPPRHGSPPTGRPPRHGGQENHRGHGPCGLHPHGPPRCPKNDGFVLLDY